MRAIAAFLVLMSWAVVGHAQEDLALRQVLGEIPLLFSECSPMDVEISVSEETAQGVGLTSDMIGNIVRSQLSHAEIYVPVEAQGAAARQILAVNLDSRGVAAVLRLQLLRYLDLGHGLPAYAIVWENVIFGVARPRQDISAEILASLVVRNVHEFLARYLPSNDGVLPCSEWREFRAEQCGWEAEAFGPGNEPTSWCGGAG